MRPNGFASTKKKHQLELVDCETGGTGGGIPENWF
jgi:hypothetical protein